MHKRSSKTLQSNKTAYKIIDLIKLIHLKNEQKGIQLKSCMLDDICFFPLDGRYWNK